jgi:hypothetical protein
LSRRSKVDAPVTRDTIEPSAERRLGGIEQVRLVPQHRHHVLRDVFGLRTFHAEPLKIAVHARREMIEQGFEGDAVAIDSHAGRQLGIVS